MKILTWFRIIVFNKNFAFIAGSQFWKSSRKIFVAKTSDVKHLERGSKSRSKRRRTDILDRLKRLVSGSDEDSDDQSVESLFDRQTTVHEFSQQSNSSGGHLEARGVAEGEELLINIFKCTICLSTSKLPAAACSSCFRIIGCVPCIEQWYESPANTGVKCPLCRGATKYEVVPISCDR